MEPNFIIKQLTRRGACMLALAVTAAACSSAPKPVLEAPAGSGPLRQQILAEIGDAACDATPQCQTLAVGHKSCGGPEGYLAWSSKRSDGARLNALAEQHRAARRQEDLREGMVSNCAIEIDSGASCVVGRCRLNPRGQALR